MIALEPIVAAILAVLLAGFGMCGDIFESMLSEAPGSRTARRCFPDTAASSTASTAISSRNDLLFFMRFIG